MSYGESASNFRCSANDRPTDRKSNQPKKACSIIAGCNGKILWDFAYVFADFSQDEKQNKIERRLLWSGDDPIAPNIQVWTSKSGAVLGEMQAEYLHKHFSRMPPGPMLFNDDAANCNEVALVLITIADRDSIHSKCTSYLTNTLQAWDHKLFWEFKNNASIHCPSVILWLFLFFSGRLLFSCRIVPKKEMIRKFWKFAWVLVISHKQTNKWLNETFGFNFSLWI